MLGSYTRVFTVMENLPVFKKGHACDILYMVKDSFEDFEINDETLTDTDNQELVFSETFDLEYGRIYSNSEGSDSDFFTDSEL